VFGGREIWESRKTPATAAATRRKVTARRATSLNTPARREPYTGTSPIITAPRLLARWPQRGHIEAYVTTGPPQWAHTAIDTRNTGEVDLDRDRWDRGEPTQRRGGDHNSNSAPASRPGSRGIVAPCAGAADCLRAGTADSLLIAMDLDLDANTEAELAGKTDALAAWLRAHAPVAVGYSGGVDSAYLAVAARRTLGAEGALAIIGRSASYPAEQWATARAVADRFDVRVLELDTAELDDPRYAANPSNRCYYCKTELWGRLVPVAHARGFSTVVDGTNADDLNDYRPGAQAAREHHVASPLAELGFTKLDIRRASRALGIPTWQQPSSPCLSSRVPYGTEVTRGRLRQIELAEASLRRLGIAGDLRVRFHDDLARVELAPAELSAWLAPDRLALLTATVAQAGFARVALDLRGFRSGSLNVLHGVGLA